MRQRIRSYAKPGGAAGDKYKCQNPKSKCQIQNSFHLKISFLLAYILRTLLSRGLRDAILTIYE